MSCKKCDDNQKLSVITYYRWKIACIELSGCNEHIKEVIEALDEAQKKITKAESFRKLVDEPN